MLEKGTLAAADPRKGQFRAFLKTDCDFFLSHRREADQVLKRGGGNVLLSIDARDAEGRYLREPADLVTAERLFDRTYALSLLDGVLERLESEHAAAGRSRHFECLQVVLSQGPRTISYAAIAEQLGMTEAAIQQAASRLRKCRRLTMALAASVLALVALGAGGYAWIERQRSVRRQATVRLVDMALVKAAALRGEAEADEAAAVVRLDAALGEIKRAEDVGRQGEAEPGLLSRVERTRQALAQLRQDADERARRAATKRAIEAALRDIGLQPADWDLTAYCVSAFDAKVALPLGAGPASR